ncbi:hypothetical protein GFL93_12750 [Rhizobium leguminosarum bv. viciae]|uniref:hypothetical protein n=1 Tax=Rhizobium TaxID=379 RepID=UPI001442222C|nr:hypothetical protein [Rhizobium leguminosarum]NKK06730.1 hypothetical protein [Rhizobium leguminosarum bv. viciae]
MMTVKHIAKTGEEYVWPATHTYFEPGDKELFFRWDADGVPHQILEGMVYVMNDHGRTVARYQLQSRTCAPAPMDHAVMIPAINEYLVPFDK